MRIRGIEVRNWACIDSLVLRDLPDGIVVLHGPNRTGKSSLVQAIRSAVFDHDHDHADSTLRGAIPWKSHTTPHVVVEFEHAGGRYRITKTFAKTREGQSLFEQQNGCGWSVLCRGKDACKKVRELIGAKTSASGVYQMLWLGQRDFKLPERKQLDSSLATSLEAVLGTLITGRDLRFKAALDKAFERWYTPETRREQKHSPVLRLAAALQAAQEMKRTTDEEWSRMEATLQDYQTALTRQPAVQRDWDAATRRRDRLQKEHEAILQRKTQLGLAARNAEQSRQLVEIAERHLRDYDADQTTLKRESALLAELRGKLQAAEQERAQAQPAAEQARQAATAADQSLLAHRQRRSELDDRQALVNLQRVIGDNEARLQEATQLDARRHELEAMLASTTAPSSELIAQLQQDQRQAITLRARLDAAEIHVSVELLEAMDIVVTRDDEPTERTRPAKEAHWRLRQTAELRIGDRAIVRIGRGAADRNVEQIAAELRELEASLHEVLEAHAIDPARPDAAELLAQRRMQHDSQASELRSVQQQLVKAAPNGIAALRAEVAQKLDERATIVARRAELGTWQPSQAECDRLRRDFGQREDELQLAADEAHDMAEQAAGTLTRLTQVEQSLRAALASQEKTLAGLQARVANVEPAALESEHSRARQRLDDALAKIKESTLTEAERAIEAEYEEAKKTQQACDERLRHNEIQLAELRTQLAGTEGLHQKRIQADQAVDDLTREHRKESLHAAAHKHLKELFETIHQEQVRRTVGPISDRVMTWARQLGLAGVADLAFDNQLLPVGFVPEQRGDGGTVELERESFGTLEQLCLLVRLAVGGLLSRTESAVAILDDPLAHADPLKHRKMLDIFCCAAKGDAGGTHPTGPMQIIVLTCHADRFDYAGIAQQIDLTSVIRRGP